MKAFRQKHLGIVMTGFVLCTALIGCSSDSNENSAPQPAPFQGNWDREGYGDLYVINDAGGAVYQYTSNTCLKVEQASNTDVAELLAGAQLSENDTRLTLHSLSNASFPVTLRRLDDLPRQCTDDRLITEATPLNVFEHFRYSYQDFYAFFNERGIDWSARVAEAQTAVHDGMSDDALFSVLAQMLEPIDDGHVQLSGNGNVYRPAQLKGANKTIEEAFAEQSEFSDIQNFANAVSQQYWETIGSYLDDNSVNSFDGAIPDRVVWGTMGNGTVGYLYIASMAYFSPEADGLDEAANLAAIESVMNDVMRDLRDTQALIIDVRKNGGGHDEVSFEIASRFMDQSTLVGSKYARSYQGETQPVEVRVQPAEGTPYLNPVAVIAGVETASAAETFLLAMDTLPQVTLVGENSNGILSDVLEKTLPNGWEIWLANEVYLDSAGESHEVTGVASEVEAPVFSLQAIEAGYNPAIDTALQVLGY